MTQDRHIHVLYGSETGTTEDHAQELARTLERLRFNVQVHEMDTLDLRALTDIKHAVFMTSTTGQGDMPINMQKFWKLLLRKRLSSTLLSSLQFTSFGLGDSTYPKYNWAVKKLHKRLLQLGAQELYPRGEGDERHDEGTDGTLIPWTTDLCKTLSKKFPLPPDVLPIPPYELLAPKYIIELNQHCTTKDVSTKVSRGPSAFTATLKRNERVTPTTHFQDVRLLELSMSRPTDHAPGDAISILPQNPSDVVDDFLSITSIDMDPDQPLTIRPNPQATNQSSTTTFDTPITLRYILTHYLDITAIPRRSFFSFISAFTSDMTHRDRLLEFTDPQYLDELYDYTTRPRRSIIEVLQEFSSVKIPVAYLLEAIPRIRPRLFSIASSSLQYSSDKPQIDLLVAIVKYKTVIKKIRQGLCTRYIASLPVGAELVVTVSKGGLSPKQGEQQTPVLMVGPGTGVAPMRALTWDRVLGKGERKGENLLCFGCRGRDVDYFFRDEWEKLEDDEEAKFGVIPAFSRDQKTKEYVQHVIKRNSKKVYELLHDLLGIVYVCGSSGRMPQAVREALVEVFEEEGKLDREDAEKYLLSLENQGRYRQETW